MVNLADDKEGSDTRRAVVFAGTMSEHTRSVISGAWDEAQVLVHRSGKTGLVSRAQRADQAVAERNAL